MSAEVGQPLNKVDSHVEPESTKKGHGKSASVSEKVSLMNAEDAEKVDMNKNANQVNWKINTSPSTVEDKELLKELIATQKNPTTGKIEGFKKMDLRIPITSGSSMKVTARNLKGVTVKDALDAIYKQNKKKEDAYLEFPYVKEFNWKETKEEGKACFIDLQKEGPVPKSGKKKGKKGGDE